MLEYIAITTLLLLSGSIWGWYSPLVTIIHFASIFVLTLKTIMNRSEPIFSKLNWGNWGICCVVLLSFIVNIIMISKDNPLSSWGSLFVIIGACIVASFISRDSFIRKYVNVVFIIAALSTFFWLLSRAGIVIGDRTIIPGNGESYRMNLFYIYRDSITELGLNRRNFGIFWEGGAYQAFLNLGILFLARFKSTVYAFDKLYWAKIITLVATVLTTFSTCGYFLLIIDFLVLVLANIQKKTGKRRTIILLVVIFAIFIINSPAVVNKFDPSSDSYISFLIRTNDYLNGFKAMLTSPYVGLGYNSRKYLDVLHSFGIYSNSAGLLITAQQFGIPFAVIYTIVQTIGFNKMYEMNHWILKVLGTLFLLLIFSTESLNQNGIFLLFLYAFEKKDAAENFEEKK